MAKWSQDLIARLTEVAGEPEWLMRFGSDRDSDSFAAATFKNIGADAVNILLDTDLPLAKSNEWAQIDIYATGWEICIYTEIGGAPDKCKTKEQTPTGDNEEKPK